MISSVGPHRTRRVRINLERASSAVLPVLVDAQVTNSVVDWRNADAMTSCRGPRRPITTAPFPRSVVCAMHVSWVTSWRNITRKPGITRPKQHQVNCSQTYVTIVNTCNARSFIHRLRKTSRKKCVVPKPLRQNKKFNYVWQNGIHCRNNVDNTACSWNKTLTKVSLEYLLFLCNMHYDFDKLIVWHFYHSFWQRRKSLPEFWRTLLLRTSFPTAGTITHTPGPWPRPRATSPSGGS